MADRLSVTRGRAWLIAMLVITPVVAWQTVRPPAVEPLPVLYTLGGDFALESTLGGITHLSDFEGDLVLLNFGYTSCPEVCPTVLSRMRAVLNMLPNGPEGRDRIRPVFITLDPTVDTLDRLSPYLSYFGPSFIGMTGSDAKVATTAAYYKVYYEKEALSSEMGYAISHSAHIYLIDGNGRVRATFGQSVTVPRMTQIVRQLLLSEPAGDSRQPVADAPATQAGVGGAQYGA